MNHDIVIFLASVAGLILYLVFSAITEMGTKLPGKKGEEETRKDEQISR
ncbi:hypothetical protein [Calothrix sp. UHCC 0171]|nr:hypothetical protein [Calothrix sp. UHCC 0171]MEA5572438.1 hypothetical protein [Calothrix sp. UHCC 0171]